MKDNKHIQKFNEHQENLNISDVSGSFTKKDLFEAFSHYAFASISNQPYNEKELIEEFEKWFKRKYPR
jgi:hypothetical protein